MRRIYLDHAATSPLVPEARDAMLPWLDSGNPSSLYLEGRSARAAIDSAREVLSKSLGCSFGEVLFTSSGTEAANLAIVGSAIAGLNGTRKRILFSAIEHHCVLETTPLLTRLGYEVELVPVSPDGVVDMSSLETMLGDDLLLVSVMHANNEIGTVQPVTEVAALCSAAGALFHCDAVQAFGVLPLTVSGIGADFLSLSAHKLGGPKGVGAIYLRAGVKPQPLSLGGGQEREMRAGTENVAAIVGFAAAVKAALADTDRAERMRVARDTFLSKLSNPSSPPHLAVSSPLRLSGSSEVLPGHAHLRFPGASAESMLIVLDRLGVSASSGAACSSGSLEPSHVLMACGYSEAEAKEGLRFTFGPSTTREDASEAAERVRQAVNQVASKLSVG
jgi:cysteine desulfurase